MDEMSGELLKIVDKPIPQLAKSRLSRLCQSGREHPTLNSIHKAMEENHVFEPTYMVPRIRRPIVLKRDRTK